MRFHSWMQFGASALALSSLIACGGDHHDAQAASDVSPAATTTTTGAPSTTGTSATTDMSGPATPTQMGNTTANGTATGVGNATAPAATDGEIIGITDAANQGEIDQAKLALQKAKDSKVKSFAKDMQTDHADAMKKLDGIASTDSITTATSQTSAKLTTDSSLALGNLQSASAKDFDKQYIDLQVKEHQDVLDSLDQKLIPQATNADLKTALKAVREKVAKHLKMAQDIQGKLASK